MFAIGSERFTTDLRFTQGAQNEQEMSILGAGFRQVGFDMKEVVSPTAQTQDAQYQSTFIGLRGTGHSSGESALVTYTSAGIPRPENRWIGPNRGGWSHPEFDRLSDVLLTTLDRGERTQLISQMTRLMSEDLPVLSMYFSVDVVAHVAGVAGPQVVSSDTPTNWNVHEWTFQ
jgi:ABC-type transport system substrate-binding protein